jgi:hypothetical protein
VSYTYAIMKVSAAAYAEIREILVKAGYPYTEQFHNHDGIGEVIDLHGVAISTRDGAEPTLRPVSGKEVTALLCSGVVVHDTTSPTKWRMVNGKIEYWLASSNEWRPSLTDLAELEAMTCLAVEAV